MANSRCEQALFDGWIKRKANKVSNAKEGGQGNREHVSLLLYKTVLMARCWSRETSGRIRWREEAKQKFQLNKRGSRRVSAEVLARGGEKEGKKDVGPYVARIPQAFAFFSHSRSTHRSSKIALKRNLVKTEAAVESRGKNKQERLFSWHTNEWTEKEMGKTRNSLTELNQAVENSGGWFRAKKAKRCFMNPTSGRAHSPSSRLLLFHSPYHPSQPCILLFTPLLEIRGFLPLNIPFPMAQPLPIPSLSNSSVNLILISTHALSLFSAYTLFPWKRGSTTQTRHGFYTVRPVIFLFHHIMKARFHVWTIVSRNYFDENDSLEGKITPRWVSLAIWNYSPRLRATIVTSFLFRFHSRTLVWHTVICWRIPSSSDQKLFLCQNFPEISSVRFNEILYGFSLELTHEKSYCPGVMTFSTESRKQSHVLEVSFSSSVLLSN